MSYKERKQEFLKFIDDQYESGVSTEEFIENAKEELGLR